MSKKQRSVLVTGGTSGIGQACAIEFATLGYAVAVAGRDAQRGQAVVDTALSRGAPAACFFQGDLSNEAFVSDLVHHHLEWVGQLDVLVNNAGVLLPGMAPETDDASWHLTMAVNVRAAFILSRDAVEHMRAKGGGTIINIASEWGLNGQQGFVAYCASKGALVQLTRSMALDHAGDNIRINAVCPGEVRTTMVEESLRRNGGSIEDDAVGIPMRRIANPDEISSVVVFLASGQSSYMTGAMVAVDGGVGAIGGPYP